MNKNKKKINDLLINSNKSKKAIQMFYGKKADNPYCPVCGLNPSNFYPIVKDILEGVLQEIYDKKENHQNDGEWIYHKDVLKIAERLFLEIKENNE